MALEFVVGGLAKFLPGETWFGPPYAERFVDSRAPWRLRTWCSPSSWPGPPARAATRSRPGFLGSAARPG